MVARIDLKFIIEQDSVCVHGNDMMIDSQTNRYVDEDHPSREVQGIRVVYDELILSGFIFRSS